jgi:hypothetical protein
VLAFDRRQRGTFNKSFEQYVSTRVGPGRINIGRQMLQRHGSLLSRIEKQFGVPPEIVVAIWGLESDFGKGDIGKMPVIRTLATMAHDCRRTELFQGELLAALKIVQRGDLPVARFDRRLSPAKSARRNSCRRPYIKYGVDFDGNGHCRPAATACPTCSPPPRTCCTPAASRLAAAFGEGTANSRSRCASGTGRQILCPRRSGILPTGGGKIKLRSAKAR